MAARAMGLFSKKKNDDREAQIEVTLPYSLSLRSRTLTKRAATYRVATPHTEPSCVLTEGCSAAPRPLRSAAPPDAHEPAVYLRSTTPRFPGQARLRAREGAAGARAATRGGRVGRRRRPRARQEAASGARLAGVDCGGAQTAD